MVYRNGLRPACLPNKFLGYPMNDLKTRPTIIGWSKTGNNHPVSEHLKEVSVPLVDLSNALLVLVWFEDDGLVTFISDVLFLSAQLLYGQSQCDKCRNVTLS